MTLRVMVIGGYGNFGSIVCRHLVVMPGVDLVISGRAPDKLLRKVDELKAQSGTVCESWCGDAMGPAFTSALGSMGIQLVIHTGGPFQGQSYAVAEGCIAAGVNYCDLSDCRTFVTGIGALDARAKHAGVVILSGCSSVPTLSAAIIDQHRYRFKRIDSIDHGISSRPGCRACRPSKAYLPTPANRSGNSRMAGCTRCLAGRA